MDSVSRGCRKPTFTSEACAFCLRVIAVPFFDIDTDKSHATSIIWAEVILRGEKNVLIALGQSAFHVHSAL